MNNRKSKFTFTRKHALKPNKDNSTAVDQRRSEATTVVKGVKSLPRTLKSSSLSKKPTATATATATATKKGETPSLPKTMKHYKKSGKRVTFSSEVITPNPSLLRKTPYFK
jgi:hypothetical protein